MPGRNLAVPMIGRRTVVLPPTAPTPVETPAPIKTNKLPRVTPTPTPRPELPGNRTSPATIGYGDTSFNFRSRLRRGFPAFQRYRHGRFAPTVTTPVITTVTPVFDTNASKSAGAQTNAVVPVEQGSGALDSATAFLSSPGFLVAIALFGAFIFLKRKGK